MVLKNSHFHFSKDPRYIKLDSLLSLVQVTLSSLTHECCCSVAESNLTLCYPWTAAHQASLSSTFSWSLLKFMSIELVMLSNHLILCCPLLLLPSIFPSIRVFSSELALRIRWPKYGASALASVLPMNIQG